MAETTRKKIEYALGTTPVSGWPTISQKAAEYLALLNEGQQDPLQAGVIAATDWAPTVAINSVSGRLELSSVGGTAWLPDPVVSGALMRSVSTSKTYFVTPSPLPAAGKYMAVGIELTAGVWGAEATVSTKSGTEKNTQAEAEASPPATTAGKLKIRDVIILNTAGAYSIINGRDRRPWARGARAIIELGLGVESHTIKLPAAVEPLNSELLALRVECSGTTLTVRVAGTLESVVTAAENATVGVGMRMDGATLPNTTDGLIIRGGFTSAPATGTFYSAVNLEYTFTPSAGSHLFVPTGQKKGTESNILAATGTPLLFSVAEAVPSANNGTS